MLQQVAVGFPFLHSFTTFVYLRRDTTYVSAASGYIEESYVYNPQKYLKNMSRSTSIRKVRNVSPSPTFFLQLLPPTSSYQKPANLIAYLQSRVIKNIKEEHEQPSIRITNGNGTPNTHQGHHSPGIRT